ncbi:hypothetical protein [Sessilibacter corallicola]|uniref:Cyclic-di-GMP receptor FimW n=1 Tax=Sessilibacter corallicola TaxID=2904075 RepID=A0ABQ0AE20_9GAMM
MFFGRTPKQQSCNFVKALQLPEPDLTTFSFCDSAKPAKIKVWIDKLPVTDAALTSVQLYRILPELARIRLPHSTRAEILEYLRPIVQNCVESITRPLSHHPLSLNNTEKKAVVIAQAIQKYLSTAYCRAAVDLYGEKKPQLITLANYIHRAMSCLSGLMKSNYQFYTPVPSDVWATTNALYRICLNAEVSEINVIDPINSNASGTSTHGYIRILALACAKPFQLRPNEVDIIHNTLQLWSKRIDLREYKEDETALYAVASCSDTEPDYATNFERQKLLNDGLAIDFSNLIHSLDKAEADQSQQAGASQQQISAQGLGPGLKQHLLTSWGRRVERQISRDDCDKTLEICLGITNIHHLLINGTKFEDFVYGTSDKSSTEIFANNWFDSKESEQEQEAQSRIYNVEMTNHSDTGYQLKCLQTIPENLQAGELMAFREPNKRNWQIAAVRWVRRSDRSGVQFGVQIIARRIEAFGACTTTALGNESDYMRVLIIKDSLNGPNESLVIPHLPFSQRFPITLSKRGEQRKVQLGQIAMATGAFSQFFFKEL